jgi:hypothetical protein
MVSNLSSTRPSLNEDGTLSAIIQDQHPAARAGTILRLQLPLPYPTAGGFGRFLLARCVEDNATARAEEWSIYARRALFCANLPTAIPGQEGSLWDLWLPDDEDPGHRWLLSRPLASSINLLGPFGEVYELAAHTRTLLVLSTIHSYPAALPIVHAMLDHGGRVTLLLKGVPAGTTELLQQIPIPVEVRFVPDDGWLNHLADPVRWADQLCAVLPNSDYAPLAHHIRTLRFQLDETFAHVLINSDLPCGVGACLACVITTRDGSNTRACVHGPVLPLARIG